MEYYYLDFVGQSLSCSYSDLPLQHEKKELDCVLIKLYLQ